MSLRDLPLLFSDKAWPVLESLDGRLYYLVCSTCDLTPLFMEGSSPGNVHAVTAIRFVPAVTPLVILTLLELATIPKQPERHDDESLPVSVLLNKSGRLGNVRLFRQRVRRGTRAARPVSRDFQQPRSVRLAWQ